MLAKESVYLKFAYSASRIADIFNNNVLVSHASVLKAVHVLGLSARYNLFLIASELRFVFCLTVYENSEQVLALVALNAYICSRRAF